MACTNVACLNSKRVIGCNVSQRSSYIRTRGCNIGTRRWHEYRQIYNYSSFNAIGCFFFFSYFKPTFWKIIHRKGIFSKNEENYCNVYTCEWMSLLFSWKKFVRKGSIRSMIICMTFLFEGNTSRSIELKGYDKRSKGFSVKHREYKMQIQAVNFNSRIILHPLPLLRFTSRRGRSCN